jgi:hypothetical protein
MPASASFFKTAALLLEGPKVQIIFVLRIFAPANFVGFEVTLPKRDCFVDTREHNTITCNARQARRNMVDKGAQISEDLQGDERTFWRLYFKRRRYYV